MEQHDKGFPKMFPNKNWSLGGLKVLIKKIDNRGTVRTVRCRPLPDTCVVNFFISTFSPARLQFLLGNILSNRLAPYFLFSGFFSEHSVYLTIINKNDRHVLEFSSYKLIMWQLCCLITRNV